MTDTQTHQWPGLSCTPRIMGTENAALYLKMAMGDIAPALSTLKQWAKPSWRAANAELVRVQKLPKAHKRPGKNGRVIWSKDTLDKYIDETAAIATRHTLTRAQRKRIKDTPPEAA